MLPSDGILDKELLAAIDPEERPYTYVEIFPRKDRHSISVFEEKYDRCIDDPHKRDFVVRMYRDFGLICEV